MKTFITLLLMVVFSNVFGQCYEKKSKSVILQPCSLRSSNSPFASTIMVLKTGDEVRLLSSSGDYWYVCVNDTTGYVNEIFLDKIHDGVTTLLGPGIVIYCKNDYAYLFENCSDVTENKYIRIYKNDLCYVTSEWPLVKIESFSNKIGWVDIRNFGSYEEYQVDSILSKIIKRIL